MKRLLIILFLFLCLIETSAIAQFQQKPMLGVPIDPTRQLGDPVGAWFFNEGSGNIANDLSGNGNVGTIPSGFTWQAGDAGLAILSDGANGSYISIPVAAGSPLDVGVTGKMTVIVRIFPTSTSGTDSIFARDRDIWCLTFFDESIGFRVGTANTTLMTGAGVKKPNEWQTLAITYDNDTGDAHLYMDGVLVKSDLGNAENIASTDHAWWFAEDPRDGTGAPYMGMYSYIQVYNRVLSASEIALLYQEPFVMMEKDDIAMMNAGVTTGIVPTPYYYRGLIPLPLLFFIIYRYKRSRKCAA